MSTYQELKGLKVKYLSSDTSGDRAKEGEVFYNSTDFNLKSFVPTAAWHSSAPLISARRAGFGAGTLTAGLAAFGRAPTASIATSEEYNGTGWTAGGTANTARFSMAGSGTQTAAVGSGGYNPPGSPGFNFAATEEYDGSSWTSTGDLSTARSACAGFGIQTAAVNVSGYTNPGSVTGAAEHYNGSSWTAGGSLNTATQKTQQACGTQTAGLAWGGDPPGGSTGSKITEEYNGSSWTASNNTNIDRSYGTRSGTQTAAVCAGGYAAITTTETYDGTSWSTSPATMATGRRDFGGADGSDTSAFACGGNTGPAFTTATEEFSVSLVTTTAGAFSSGTNLPTEKGQGGGCGTQTAAMITGGLTAPAPGNETTTFHYDGSSWTSGGALPSGRRNNSAFGIQTAAVTLGNLNPVDATIDVYNGSSWTGGTNYPSPNSNTGVAGTTTAGLVWGGDQDPGFLSTTNEYGGSWTAGGALPAARSNAACAGTQTAAVTVGGRSPNATTLVNTALEYDGTNWSSSNNDLVTRYNAGGAGIQTSALIFGGQTPSVTATATLYDGTSFVTQPSMGTARFLQTQGLGATSTVALAAAGQTTTRVGTVEEFTGETTASVAAKTIDFD